MISLLSGSGSTPSSKALVAQQIKELTSQIAGLLDTATNLKGVMVDTDKDLLSTADTIKNTLKDIGDTIKSKTSADTCQVC